MDDVADLRGMKIRQWTEKTEDREQCRLSRRPRLTQGCSARRMDGLCTEADIEGLSQAACMITVTH
jgi:hypothetical protein